MLVYGCLHLNRFLSPPIGGSTSLWSYYSWHDDSGLCVLVIFHFDCAFLSVGGACLLLLCILDFQLLLRMFLGILLVWGSRPVNAPQVPDDKVIWRVLRFQHRIFFRRVSVPSHGIVGPSVLLRSSDDTIYTMFSRFHFVFVDFSLLSSWFGRVSPLRFDLLQR